MQQAIPYKSWVPLYTTTNNPLNHQSAPLSRLVGGATDSNDNKDQDLLKGSRNMANLVQENAIIVFARRGCCMSHVVKRLLLGLGVNPPIYEIDDEEDEVSVLEELEIIVNNINNNHNYSNIVGNDRKIQFPAVFIGGRLFGGLDRLMATHISGELVPILKEAGALWL